MGYIARQLFDVDPDIAHTCGLFCHVGIPVLLQGVKGYEQTLKNAIWFFEGYGLETAKCYIYNRWGEQVFFKQGWGRENGWDGYYKGKLQSQDVYHYSAVVEFYTGEKLAKKGDITLLR